MGWANRSVPQSMPLYEPMSLLCSGLRQSRKKKPKEKKRGVCVKRAPQVLCTHKARLASWHA